MKEKQRFSLRKNKIGLCSVLLGFAVVAVLGTTTEYVHAADVAGSNATTISGNKDSVSDEDVLKSKELVESKKKEALKAEQDQLAIEKKVSEKEQEVLATQKEIEHKNAELKLLQDASNGANNITNEKIEELKATITREKQTLSQKQQELETLKQSKVQKEQEKTNSNQELTEKNTQKEQAQNEKNEATKKQVAAQKDLTTHEQNIKAKQAEVETVNSDLTNKSIQVTNQNTAVKNAENQLNAAKQADENRKNEINTAKSDLSAKETAVTEKEAVKKEKERDVATAEEHAKNAFSYPTKFVTTEEWIKAFKELLTEYNRGSQADKAKLNELMNKATSLDNEGDKAFVAYANSIRPNLVFEGNSRSYSTTTFFNRGEEERTSIYRYEKNGKQLTKDIIVPAHSAISVAEDIHETVNRTNRIYDPNNLPEDVLMELNQYFATLLNSIRTQLGLQEVKINKNSIEFAKEAANVVVRDKHIRPGGHYVRGINEVAYNRGLRISAPLGQDGPGQLYENLSVTSVEGDKVSKAELYEVVTDAVKGFFFEGAQKYGHALNLSNVSNFGVAFSLVKGDNVDDIQGHRVNPDGSYTLDENGNLIPEKSSSLKFHVLSVEKNRVDPKNPNSKKVNYEEMYGPTSSANVEKMKYISDKESQKAVEKAKAALAEANKNLIEVKKAVETAKDVVRQKEAIPTQTEGATAAHRQATEVLRRLNDEKQTLQNRKNQLEAEVRQLTTEKSAKEEAVRQRQEEVTRKEVLLNTAVQHLQAAQNKNQVLQNELTSIESTITAKESTINQLNAKIQQDEAEVNQLVNLLNKKQSINAAIQEISTKLQEISSKLEQQKEEYRQLNSQKTALQAELQKQKGALKTLENNYQTLLKKYTKQHTPDSAVFDVEVELPKMDITEGEETSQEIPYKTIRKEDSTLLKGKEVVSQKGQNGLKTLKTVTLSQNGEVKDVSVVEKVVKEAIDEVILVGTKVEQPPVVEPNGNDAGNGAANGTTGSHENPIHTNPNEENPGYSHPRPTHNPSTTNPGNGSNTTPVRPLTPTVSGGRKHNPVLSTPKEEKKPTSTTSSKVSGWKLENGEWYYSENGVQVTGWTKVNGVWYYLKENGAMATGWLNDKGTWYYLDGSGAMQTGWKYVDGKWYYLNNSGAMQTGWKYVDGKWYYLDGSGAMQTGWKYVDGKWYYLNESGALLVNTTTPDGYTVNTNGEWV